MKLIPNAIGGRAAPAKSGRTIEDINPATGQVIALVPRSGPEDVAVAVAAAKAAQPAWDALGRAERCRTLRRIADALEARLGDLARMETEDTGKPITTSSTLDIPRAVRNFRFFADHAEAFQDRTHSMSSGHNRTHRRAVGVAGLITPWNLPLYLLSWKVAPALAMGNAVVAKPSEMTPQTATALAGIASEAGLPPGVLNIVHGLGPEAGQALVEHPDVKAISFTGGTATGTKVAKTAAPMFKKLSLELGGKNATIILDDADLDRAVAGAVKAGFTNTGQVCLCGSRILVPRSMHDAFVVKLQEAVATMPLGDPMDPDTRLGPLVSKEHRNKVHAYIGMARHDHTVWGGDRPKLKPPLDGGAFLQPAIITGAPQDSPCVQDEIFGPVVTVQPYKGDAQAIDLANGVRYGLAASIWGKDDHRLQAMAEKLETGMVWINDWLVRDLRVPFGGMKESGVGREGGDWSLEFFSEARNIYTAKMAGGSL